MVSCNGGLNQMRAAVSTVYQNLNTTIRELYSEFLRLLKCPHIKVYIYESLSLLKRWNSSPIVLLFLPFFLSYRFVIWWQLQGIWMLLLLYQSWIKLHFGLILGDNFFLQSLQIHFQLFCLQFILVLYSDFQDIFDVDYFIASLRDEVRILRQLPPRLKRRAEMGFLHSMPPISWSDISYYHHQVWLHLPFFTNATSWAETISETRWRL